MQIKNFTYDHMDARAEIRFTSGHYCHFEIVETTRSKNECLVTIKRMAEKFDTRHRDILAFVASRYLAYKNTILRPDELPYNERRFTEGLCLAGISADDTEGYIAWVASNDIFDDQMIIVKLGPDLELLDAMLSGYDEREGFFG